MTERINIILRVAPFVSAVAAMAIIPMMAASLLYEWFNRGGPYCSHSDGATVEDPDWEIVSNNPSVHFRVRLEGQWVNVPDDRVMFEPNKSGKAMVRYGDYSQVGPERVRFEIRCFMPGG